MTNIKFRTLTKDDVECRVCNATQQRINLLIYKNARVDMSILNETVGCIGWTRRHEFKNGINYCTVSIYDSASKEWVSKEDCGVESNTEAQKGESSDSFKRACFNWGIGIELYSGPKISIPRQPTDDYNGKLAMTFGVSELTVSDDHKITHITIVDRFGKVRYTWDAKLPANPFEPAPSAAPEAQKPQASAYQPMDAQRYWQYVAAAARGEKGKSGKTMKEIWAKATHAGAPEMAQFDTDVERVIYANNPKN